MRIIQFCLVVVNFGVKYTRNEHAEHLKGALEEHYELFTDWMGEKYVWLMLREVHLLMPEYVYHALKCFQHPLPRKPQYQPHPHVLPKYV